MRKFLIILSVIILTGCSFNKCPDGYNFNNNFCEKKLNEKAKERITCEEGYKLEGDKCVKEIQELAEVVEYCPKGYDKEDGYCILVDKYNAKLNKWCDKGILENGTCYEYYYTDAYVRQVCPSNYPNRDYGGPDDCFQYYNVYKAETKYGEYDESWALPTCKDGDYWYPSRSGYCAKKRYTSLVDEYYCYYGELVGTKCLNKTIVDSPKTEYESCKAGYTGTAVCLKTDVVDYKKDYKCKVGYELNGLLCLKTEEKETLTEQFCEGDLKPKDGMCIGVTRVPLNK